MNKLIDVARKQFEKTFYVLDGKCLIKDDRGADGKYLNANVEQTWQIFLRGFAAAHEWDAKLPPTYEGLNGPVIDLDFEAWESIKIASAQSTWIPQEYCMNDWVSDVCDFLRNGVQKPEM